MGNVRQVPQASPEGQQSGIVGLEITYGGRESPFGGIDASKPPAYIDPNCFTQSESFLVVDDQLIVASLQVQTLPTLWNGLSNYIFLKMGTFYNSKYGYINYALGVQIQIHIHTGSNAPSFYAYNFALTAWQYDSLNTPTVIGNDLYTVRVYNTDLSATQASLTLPVVMGESATYTDSGTVALTFAAGGTASFSYTPGNTVLQIVAGMVIALNALSGTSLTTATATADGLGIILTAIGAGSSGNSIAVVDASASSLAATGVPPAFYFPTIPTGGFTNLQGGTDGGIQTLPNLLPNPQVSSVDVGGTIYFANLGPIIMKYSGPGTLAISSMYAGVRTISKFAGSLIGLGNLPQLLNVVNNADMIFSWSAANNLDEWSPLDVNGNVTGAGFAQLADVATALRGLIVTGNTAFILREQGISYATSLGSGTQPFSFQHISLSDEGEGAQNTALICQYDQTGAFVGNTNVFQISESIGAIGDKITANLLTALDASTGPLSAAACAVMIGRRVEPVIVFLVDSMLYIYIPSNRTWMQMSFTTGLSSNATVQLTSLSSYNTATDVQRKALLSLVTSPATTGTTTLYALQEGNGFSNQPNPNAFLHFPQEELLLGRDVTIDSILLLVNYNITGQVVLATLFNGVTFATMGLTAGNNMGQVPQEIRLFPNTGIFTAHSPQLEVEVLTGVAPTLAFRITKIVVYGSFEPNQRPT